MDEKRLKVLLQWPTLNHPLLTSFQIAKIPLFHSRSYLNFLDLQDGSSQIHRRLIIMLVRTEGSGIV